jgi:hypothetical protein
MRSAIDAFHVCAISASDKEKFHKEKSSISPLNMRFFRKHSRETPSAAW